MKHFLKILACGLIVSLLSGCMSIPKVDMSYKTKPVFKIKPIKPSKTISFAKVKDLRGGDPTLIGSTTDTEPMAYYGIEVTSTLKYAAKEPLINTIAETINQALKDNGYKLTENNPNYLLKVNLLDVKIRQISGMFSSDFFCRLTMQILLQDAKTDRLIFKRTLTSEGKQHLQGFGNVRDLYWFVRESFHQALNGIISQLLNSSEFKAAIVR